MRDPLAEPLDTPGAAASDHLLCPECGYDLRMRVSQRCPECGLALDFIHSDTSLILWEYPAGRGLVRSWWMTAVESLVRPRRFCRAIFAPVSLRSAQRFRGVIIGICAIWLLLGIGALALVAPAPVVALHTLFGTAMILTLCAGWVLTLLVLTGLPSYFFAARRLGAAQSERAVAISYYAATPLIFSAVPLGLLTAACALQGSRGDLDVWLLLSSIFTTIVVMALFWNTVRRFHRYAAHSGVINWWLFLLLPAMWFVLGAAAIVLPPALLFFGQVVVSSLR